MPYSAAFIADLERTISRARLSRYLAATGGDLDTALSLYEKNAALTEAVFGLLQGVEVPVRNSLHYVFSRDLGLDDWCHDNLPLPFPTAKRLSFTLKMRKMVEKARQQAGPHAAVGKVIAELTFGFWPFLISGQFHPLWTDCLHKAFPHAAVPRSHVHTRLETIQRLRNRVAHHEPILSSTNEVYTGSSAQPKIDLPAILECVAWVSPATADWVQTTTRYDQALALLSEFSATGINL